LVFKNFQTKDRIVFTWTSSFKINVWHWKRTRNCSQSRSLFLLCSINVWTYWKNWKTQALLMLKICCLHKSLKIYYI